MIISPKPAGRPDRYQPPPERPQSRRSATQRAWGFGLVIALLFFGLLSRLWFLQVVHGDDFKDAAAANQARRIRTRAPRGAIVDRNGVLLAANRPRLAIYAVPAVAKDPAELAQLAALIHVTPDEIAQTIADTKQNPYDPLRIALDVPLSTITQIEENRPFLPGVSTQPEPVRWYPKGDLAAHLIGTMGRINADELKDARTQGYAGYFTDDFLGKTGIEDAYESYLRGRPGGTDVQIDAHGRTVQRMAAQEAAPGGTVHLTIDAGVQAAGERVFKEHNFVGAAVALDPRTGAVLAMVSAPTFDPNKFATGITSKNWAPIHADPTHPLIDRAIDAMYPPGSTFKPVVAAAGLETGAITTQSRVYCTGSYHLGRARFGCWEVHGDTDFTKAIAQSCDVFFYVAGRKIGPDKIAYYSKKFGLAEKTGIDLPEDIGTIPSPAWKAKHFKRLGPQYSDWFPGDTLHMSIGQGDVLTTPLQMARVAAALANGGNVLTPYTVAKITDGDTDAVRFEAAPKIVRHVPVSAANMEAVRRAMRATVTNGTGKIVSFKDLAVAAKTGSAQTQGNSKTHGLFICFAPYDHPTIAIAAIVEHGGHGGDTAGRVARAMLQSYFHLKDTGGASSRSD